MPDPLLRFIRNGGKIRIARNVFQKCCPSAMAMHCATRFAVGFDCCARPDHLRSIRRSCANTAMPALTPWPYHPMRPWMFNARLGRNLTAFSRLNPPMRRDSRTVQLSTSISMWGWACAARVQSCPCATAQFGRDYPAPPEKFRPRFANPE